MAEHSRETKSTLIRRYACRVCEAGEASRAQGGLGQALGPDHDRDAEIVLGFVQLEGNGPVPSRELADKRDGEIERAAALEVEKLAHRQGVLLVPSPPLPRSR